MILPVTEEGSSFVLKHRGSISAHSAIPNLPGQKQLDIVQDKLHTAEFLAEHGLPTPRTVLLTSDRPSSYTADHEVLVKPRFGSGGEGITRFQDHATAWKQTQGKANERELIVQEYIPGTDIDCSVYCENGMIKAHTIQKRLQYIKRDQYKPSRSIEFLSDIKVYQLISEFISKINWNGVAHIDLRYDADNNKLYILEINGRYWTTLLGSAHVGINFPLIHGGLIPTGQVFIGVGRYYSLLDILVTPSQILSNLRDLSFWENLRDPLPQLLK